MSGDLTLYLMALTFDAAVQSDAMFFGISCLYEYDKFQKGTVMAHEFHHRLRVSKTLLGNLSKYEEASFSIIDEINNEGTADLVDKPVDLKYRDKLYQSDNMMKELLDNVDITLKKLDSSLTLNSKSGEAFVSKKDFRSITKSSSGHIPGFYMSNIIKRNGLEKELIDGSDNPFNIFYLYNKAARIDFEEPTSYSSPTMDYLKKLELKLN